MTLAAAIHILKSCLVVLTALFPIVNPLGNTPIFLSLTPGYSSDARTVLSRKIALNSFWLLTGSMLIGSHILTFFGISIPVVQVGGGLVVMFTGWTLLQQREAEQSRTHEAKKKITKEDIANRAFYPLTLPLTVGPGSISVALTLGVNEALQRSNLVRLIAAIVGPALVAITIYLSYRFAERLARVLGETAMNVIVRLTSFILLCIGVQIVWGGIRALINSVH
ncbi:MAG: NAAT family transporter [Acidobacteriaceae bacterium]|nr:NAAT family transporter [Acidobacteriaceae bacterium]MBV9034021.1 NAAT family transporter [Acidobacteriaceae bacterium]MBV9223007.1 NAAT family transporter [Acidobacteriaceae bacterium]MBV9307967.1 NAAT family transporter [Acidobacteriaceae bacterium]MBV9675181.1 NAAT family transporter [Acidobacteriaceae bacterium]